jgi:hypothetical protein
MSHGHNRLMGLASTMVCIELSLGRFIRARMAKLLQATLLHRYATHRVQPQAMTLPKSPLGYRQAIGALHQVLESKETSCLDVK